MRNNEQRIDEINKRLTRALTPSELEITDESDLHRGHSGNKNGLGHFAVSITAEAFAGKNLLERHRLIYDALGEMMQTDIHALRVIRAD